MIIVYVISHFRDEAACNPVKVGIAKHPYNRLKSLQTGNPVKLCVFFGVFARDRLHALDLKRQFHTWASENTCASENRLCGWFAMDPEDAASELRELFFLSLGRHDPGEDIFGPARGEVFLPVIPQ